MTLKQITCFLTIIPIISLGQHSVNGTFYDSNNQRFTFTDSTFVYNGGSCGGPVFGRGRFQLSDNSIELNFSYETGKIRIINEAQSTGDTLNFQIITRSKSKEIVPGTMVAFYQKQPEDETPMYVYTTDEKGTLNAFIAKDDKIEFIEVWAVNSVPFFEKLKIEHNYLLEAEIQTNHPDTIYLKAGLYEYRVKRINEKLISLGRQVNGHNLYPLFNRDRKVIKLQKNKH